ncbi:hypothetical protein AsFPU1_4371 [Aphanothece sacrum FPU1]|uniref:Uncharacterized protein n=1 Tax=Aphanothece sacrum FPU1 TaxID=1920663 RepID=A0A401INX9_APHSA|nr:hypothetical protein AsFPU1_4371 [Aphanothece sacrum FPU1]GBF86917.1 hypothetical protein AsFPU3_3994 [Aphanothece sacrum FPU3]
MTATGNFTCFVLIACTKPLIPNVLSKAIPKMILLELFMSNVLNFGIDTHTLNSKYQEVKKLEDLRVVART